MSHLFLLLLRIEPSLREVAGNLTLAGDLGGSIVVEEVVAVASESVVIEDFTAAITF